MFETVVPETVAPRSRKLMAGTLPLSLGVHALAAALLVFFTNWNVAFPNQSPKLYAAYSLTASPPPPPPPPPPRRPPTAEAVPVTMKMPLVAPNIIPDEIPVLSQMPVDDVEAAPVAASEGVEGGVEGGIEGGLIGGLIGGTVGGLIGGPPPEVIQIRRDEPLPVGAISQDFPMYPDFAKTRGWEDTLVVRYLIGKDGRIKEVKVIQQPDREEFARATLDAIRHWRFHPFRDETGQPKEVSHELTVEFRIKRVRK